MKRKAATKVQHLGLRVSIGGLASDSTPSHRYGRAQGQRAIARSTQHRTREAGGGGRTSNRAVASRRSRSALSLACTGATGTAAAVRQPARKARRQRQLAFMWHIEVVRCKVGRLNKRRRGRRSKMTPNHRMTRPAQFPKRVRVRVGVCPAGRCVRSMKKAAAGPASPGRRGACSGPAPSAACSASRSPSGTSPPASGAPEATQIRGE